MMLVKSAKGDARMCSAAAAAAAAALGMTKVSAQFLSASIFAVGRQS